MEMHDNSRAENNNRDRKSISMEETKNNTVNIGVKLPKAKIVSGFGTIYTMKISQLQISRKLHMFFWKVGRLVNSMSGPCFRQSEMA